MFVPVPVCPGGRIEMEKLPKSFQTMPLPVQPAAPSALGCGVMLPALCLCSSPALFSAGLACALPAEPGDADARPRRVLLPGWGCCVGPRSIGGPGLPRAWLMSSDLSQGSVGWQPVKCHFVLSRSRFNPFPPLFFPGGKCVPGRAAPDPVSGGVGCQGTRSCCSRGSRQQPGLGEKQPSSAD